MKVYGKEFVVEKDETPAKEVILLDSDEKGEEKMEMGGSAINNPPDSDQEELLECEV